MSWDEIRTRLAQEGQKRLDLAWYRLGFSRKPELLLELPADRTHFFFPTAELSRRVALLREHLPHEVENVLSRADAICRHEFDLLGYEKLDYGQDIDWHLDRVNGKRAPLKPWFEVDFLDFSEVGDHKVTWELNRHQHLVTLAKAWLLCGDKRYVQELAGQWHSWQEANPYPIGINWASSLEVAFRSLSWIWVLRLIAGCPELPATFPLEVMQGLWRSGSYIEKYLSTYFSPNTHLIGEAAALFFLGTVCRELPDSRRWRAKGWRILMEECERQVRADGTYFEQSLYYHVYALDFFLHARVLAACNEMEIPSAFDATLEKMIEVLCALSQAGPAEGFGDDDGGRVFDPHRNRTEHMTDPLTIGALLFRRDDFRSVAKLTEEAIWLFGEQAPQNLRSCSQASPEPKSTVFPDGGIYVIAAAEPQSQLMMIDAGPQGTGRSGHGHADALSVRFTLDGRRWLIDSGTYCYHAQSDERGLFRGTGAHNTLQVGGLDQAVEDGPFAWTSIPKVNVESWVEGKTFTLFIGSHNGYQRLPDPVLHRRMVIHVGHLWCVRDVVLGNGSQDFGINWHFASDLRLQRSDAGFLAIQPDGNLRTQLALLPAQRAGWSSEIVRHYASPSYGVKEPTPKVRCSSRTKLPAEFATLLVPLEDELRGHGKFISLRAPGVEEDGVVNAYRYDRMANKSYMIFCDHGNAWSMGPWNSDAGFLYFRCDENRILHVVACGASFIKFNMDFVLRCSQAVERWEWIKEADTEKIFCSDPAVIQLSVEQVLGSGSALF